MSTEPQRAVNERNIDPTADLDGDRATIDGLEDPPRSIKGILSRLGPGLIIAASIVGSGELIATTITGAKAGFTLLWLILIGCLIKVFSQIEIGRFTMTEGRTALDAFDQVPGPRARVGWLCWYWLIMYIASIGQLGGIVGIVGQSLAISAPITGDYNKLLEEQEQYDAHRRIWEDSRKNETGDEKTAVQTTDGVELGERPWYRTRDDMLWSAITAVATSLMLIVGRYGFVQHVSTILVALFTMMSVANLCALQSQPLWTMHASDIWHGLSLQLPETGNGLAVALATFGIIGVGASELVAYPYWCLEKGYARATGPRDQSAAWAMRARGWFNVLCWDAWCSMAVYTFATIAFYLTGATVLNRANRVPDDTRLIPTLMEMYKPVFGVAAEWIFLFGAFAVLYSTFFVASAGNARIAADGLRVFRCVDNNERNYRHWTRIFCGLIPLISFVIYFVNPRPVSLVMISGLAQAIMLPMLGYAALYFRYYRCDARLRPGMFWTVCLWLSFGVLLITGGWGMYANWSKLSETLFP